MKPFPPSHKSASPHKIMHGLRMGTAKGWETLSYVLFPPSCPGCGVKVAQNGTICPHCWQELHFICQPLCPVMGSPFPYDAGEGLLSGEALRDPPPFQAARSAVVHNGLAKNMVTRLKYGAHTELAPLMARWMMRAGEDFFANKPLIIPVPLHSFRFWQRGYNQSAELARIIAAKTNTTFLPQALIRTKRTRQQVGLSAKERKNNVLAAFQVPKHMQPSIEKQNIVLIDDVFTTGATVRAATVALRKAQALSVNVLTFSRVVVS